MSRWSPLPKEPQPDRLKLRSYTTNVGTNYAASVVDDRPLMRLLSYSAGDTYPSDECRLFVL